MKCPECERTGQRSKLFMPDAYMCTAMGGSQSFYDEDGEKHYHDINSAMGQGHCSNHHLIDVTRSTKCAAPGCNWGHEQTMAVRPPQPAKPEPTYFKFDTTISFPSGMGG